MVQDCQDGRLPVDLVGDGPVGCYMKGKPAGGRVVLGRGLF